MTTEEKAKLYDEALEKAKQALKTDLHESGVWAIKSIFPEFAESEDERIRKMIEQALIEHDWSATYKVSKDNCLAYLEKQKEQPKEELVYRLNGLMQDYIKEGKDEEEKEHRFKCYQLFWDALEDGEFFEQKEQKPSTPEDIAAAYQMGLAKGREEQKPAEWSEEDEKRIKQLIYDTEAIRAGYEKKKDLLGECFNETLIKDCDEQISWLKSLRPQPKQEWTDNDEQHLKWLCRIIHSRRNHGELSLTEESELGNWIDKWINHNPHPHWKPSDQ